MMEADLTIVHVRPRTEEERLRDATLEAEAEDPIDPVVSNPTSLTILHTEPVTPLGKSRRHVSETHSSYSNALECPPMNPTKKRENSRRERLKKTSRIYYKRFLHEQSEMDEEGKFDKKSCGVMPSSQVNESRSDKQARMESLRGAVNIYLFPEKNEPPGRGQNALDLLMKNTKGTNNDGDSCVDVLNMVFEAMKRNTMDSVVQEKGCHLLTKLARDSEEVQTEIVRRGAVQLIINAMANHTKTPELQSRAIGTLLCLTMNETARAQIVEQRGAELISWAMKEFPDMLQLHKLGATCLCNLAFSSEENKRRIGRIGGIHAVVSAMNKFVANADLQARCCLALRNLTYGLRANQWIAGRCQAMEAVLQSMRLMKSDMNIQYQGCVALANMCADEGENRPRAADLKVHKVAIDLMRKHMENSSLCEHAMTVLRNICILSGQNQASVGEDGGIDLILSCMKVHRFNKRVIERGCSVLRYLFFNKANRLRFAECNGIDAMVRIMRDAADHLDVSEAVIYAIGNAVYDNLDSKRAVGRLGGISALVEIMSNHLDSAAIQEHACRALRNLADADELNLRLITECGAIDAVLLAMMGYLDNGNIQEQGCAMLVNVTMLEEGLRQMRELEAQLVVKRSKCMHIDKERVQCQAAALLTRLEQGPSAHMVPPTLPRKKTSRVDAFRRVAPRGTFGKRPKPEAKHALWSRGTDDTVYNGKLVRLVGSSEST